MTQRELSFGPSEAKRRQGNKERLLNILRDGKWHANTELNFSAGFRYGARLLELRKSGLTVHSVSVGAGKWKYRLDEAGSVLHDCIGPCCLGREP